MILQMTNGRVESLPRTELEKLKSQHQQAIDQIDRELDYRGPAEKQMWGFLTTEGWFAKSDFGAAADGAVEYFSDIPPEDARYRVQKLFVKVA